MLLSPHLLTGAYIGKFVDSPSLAFFLGVIFHFVLDAIPHSDGPDDNCKNCVEKPWPTAQYIIVAADFLVLITSTLIILSQQKITTSEIAGAFGGFLPDLIDNVPFWKNRIRKISGFKQFHAFHSAIQKYKLSFLAGMLLQIFIVLILVFLFLH